MDYKVNNCDDQFSSNIPQSKMEILAGTQIG